MANYTGRGGFKPGYDPRRVKDGYVRHCIPVERVRPLARYLVKVYGYRPLMEILPMSSGTFNAACYSRTRKYVAPETAQKIVDAVLVLRRPEGADPVRLPTMAERIEAQREVWAEEQRKARAVPSGSRT